MFLMRAASAAAAIAVSIFFVTRAVPVSGQGAATARGRSEERINGRRAVSGEVLVRFRSTPTIASLNGLELDDNERLLNGVRLLRSRRATAGQLLSRLAARADVLYAEPNYLIEPTRAPNDPFYPLQTGASNPSGTGDARLPAAWAEAVGTRLGVIALLDSGVDATHPDLAANLWSSPTPFTVDIGGYAITCPAGTHGFNAVTLSCDPRDQLGHGTAMAGVIGAVGNNGTGVAGVNWSASIMPVKFIDADGLGSYGDAIRAIDFTMQINRMFGHLGGRVRVLSASWRGTAPSRALSDAVAAAEAEDMLLVAAAGNDGVDIDATPVYPAGLGTANVVAVAAADGSDVTEWYSNVGTMSVDLAAPGSTHSTAVGGGYVDVGGTSVAAAFVAGAAHLLLSRCTLTTPQLRAVLLDNVDIVSSLATSVATSGRLNTDRSMAACRGANAAPVISFLGPSARNVYEGDTIYLETDAFDVDGAVGHVDFFVGSAWVGRDSASPFILESAPWPNGTYVVSAVATDTAGATAASLPITVSVVPPATAVPAPWMHQDIGATGVAGSVSAMGSGFTVAGGGADVWGYTDAFTFVAQPLTGDGEIVARITSLEYIDPWTKAGVMIRETLAPDSGHAFMLVSADRGDAFQRRPVAGGATLHTAAGSGVVPMWVRVMRHGTRITASTSADGVTWVDVGSETVSWQSTVYAGLAVTSHRAGVLAAATFDNIAIRQGTSPPPPVAPLLPPGWTASDVGAVGVSGASQAHDGVFAVSGAGADIWSTEDAFHFAHTALRGDGEIVARVASLTGPRSWTKVGVMIRSTLEPGAPHGLALVSLGKGAAFQRRASAGGITTHTSAGEVGAPLWLRLTRIGQTVTAFTSFDGYSWVAAGSDTIALGDTALIGLAVSSHDPAIAAEALFDQVSINAFASPVVSHLPPGWAGTDVGAVGIVGGSEESGGRFVLVGAGADIWDTSDAFHFVHVALPGDGTITAKVVSLDSVHEWSKAGVMVRESLSPSAAHAFALVSAANGVAFQRRTSTDAPTVHTGGPPGGAPQWLRLTRTGSVVTAFASPDGVAWSVIGSDVLSAEGPVYVGLAVSSHDLSRAAGAAFTNVTIGH
jgi:regulation of enolase protein 1 (concanavalin A-like superfamily)